MAPLPDLAAAPPGPSLRGCLRGSGWSAGAPPPGFNGGAKAPAPSPFRHAAVRDAPATLAAANAPSVAMGAAAAVVTALAVVASRRQRGVRGATRWAALRGFGPGAASRVVLRARRFEEAKPWKDEEADVEDDREDPQGYGGPDAGKAERKAALKLKRKKRRAIKRNPGRWNCKVCGNHNYEFREVCNFCNRRKGMTKTQLQEEYLSKGATLAQEPAPVFAPAREVFAASGELEEEVRRARETEPAEPSRGLRPARARVDDSEINVLEKARLVAEADWQDVRDDILLVDGMMGSDSFDGMLPRTFLKRVKNASVPTSIAEHIELHQLGKRRLRMLPRGITRPKDFSGSDPAHNGRMDSLDDGKVDTLGRMAAAVGDGFMRRRASSYCNGLRDQPGVFPLAERPEFAFIGASNVGKSSMLNALTRTQALAEARDEPGLTRSIAWYKPSRLPADILDLPGYGFARGADFGLPLADFVANRKALRGLYVLIDARCGLRPSDWRWLQQLGLGGPEKTFVLTKCDQVLPRRLGKIARVVLEDLKLIPRAQQRLIMVSSKQGQGMHDLRMQLCARSVELANRARRRHGKRYTDAAQLTRLAA